MRVDNARVSLNRVAGGEESGGEKTGIRSDSRVDLTCVCDIRSRPMVPGKLWERSILRLSLVGAKTEKATQVWSKLSSKSIILSTFFFTSSSSLAVFETVTLTKRKKNKIASEVVEP